jgi:titin
MPLPAWLASIDWPIRTCKSRSSRQVPRPHVRPRLEVLEGRWLPSTFLVTNTDDAGAGSLRQAILDANAAPGVNEIDFAVGGGGAQIIQPRTDLPIITHAVVIDGTTQPGFAGSPLIDIDGGAVTYVNGLIIEASFCTVRGLAMTNFNVPDDPCTVEWGILIDGNNNVVEGNYIGVGLDGTQRMSNSIGVQLSGSGNRIGGTTAAQRNIISGNDVAGVAVGGTNNVVLGNYIGTDATGTVAVANGDGVQLGGSNDLVGGTTAAARNIISGNRDTGIRIHVYYGDGARSNIVQGNYIGTDVTGAKALANSNGIDFNGSGYGTTGGWLNLIGGTAPGAGNVISGNRFWGVDIGSTNLGNVVQGNRIGTDAAGTQAVGNGVDGIAMYGTSATLVGGTDAGAGNVISGNGRHGISILKPFSSNDTGSTVQGNLIGTDVGGIQPLGNVQDGVHVSGSNNNTIGGDTDGAGNVIAFNGGDGVRLDGGTSNAVLGNAIFGNGGLAIELLHGANNEQPAPVITAATSGGLTTTIQGALTAAANTTYRLQFFTGSDGSGGQRLLGTVQVTTDGDGNASFTATFDTAVDAGMFLTATATDSANNTSPFSNPVPVTG